jgi:serine/threonine protein kinase
MAMQLLVIAGPDQGRIFPLSGGRVLAIGRSHAHSEIILQDLKVARVHCQIEVDESAFVLTDLESPTGTFINDKSVTRQQLLPGDLIRLGDTQFRFQDEAAAKAAPAAAPTLAPAGEGPLPFERFSELAETTLGHYELGPLLGKGQVGMVFRARDQNSDKKVALKVLHPAFPKTEEERQIFIRAAKAMLALEHPNLVRMFGAGKAGFYHWIATELVEGESLAQWLGRTRSAGLLGWQHAFRIAVQMARALKYGHDHQMVHRNITPQSILVRTSDHFAKLNDLFLAQALDGSQVKQITLRSKTMSELYYFSPEQTYGNMPVDARSDIFSLGTVIYTMLTSRPPFEGKTSAEVVGKIRQADAVPPRQWQPSIPPLFEETLLKMLAKRPEDRFPSADGLLAHLEQVTQHKA